MARGRKAQTVAAAVRTQKVMEGVEEEEVRREAQTQRVAAAEMQPAAVGQGEEAQRVAATETQRVTREACSKV